MHLLKIANMEFIYILAPQTAGNYAALQEACTQFPDLTQERRVKQVHKKDAADILDDEGALLVPAGTSYLYLKATASEFDPIMLDGVTDAETFNIDNQPFDTYWL